MVDQHHPIQYLMYFKSKIHFLTENVCSLPWEKDNSSYQSLGGCDTHAKSAKVQVKASESGLACENGIIQTCRIIESHV